MNSLGFCLARLHAWIAGWRRHCEWASPIWPQATRHIMVVFTHRHAHTHKFEDASNNKKKKVQLSSHRVHECQTSPVGSRGQLSLSIAPSFYPCVCLCIFVYSAREKCLPYSLGLIFRTVYSDILLIRWIMLLIARIESSRSRTH